MSTPPSTLPVSDFAASAAASSASFEEDDSDIPWDCIDELVRGAALLKFGRQGEPHFRFFRLEQDCQVLSWQTHKKASAESRVMLTACRVIEGQSTDVFKRQPRPDLVDLSFSLEYDDPQRRGRLRTLDVICKDRREYEVWTRALRYLTGGAPPASLLATRRATVWAAFDLEEDAGREALAERVKMLKRDLKKRIKDTNDVYAFGDNAWGQLGLDGEASQPVPTIVPALLGKAVKVAACGASHVMLLTDTGEAYAMGHGGAGRLGTGSVEHEPLPRLLLRPATTGSSHVREPYRFRAIACGDMHTVAVGADGFGYAWGCGYNGATGLGADPDVAGLDMLWPTRIPAFACVVREDRVPVDSSFASSASDDTIEFKSMEAWGKPDAVGARPASRAPQGDMPKALRLMARSDVSLQSVSAGSGYSAFLDADGSLFLCGISGSPLGWTRELLRLLLTSCMHAAADSPFATYSYVVECLQACEESGGAAATQEVEGGVTGAELGDLHVPLQVCAGSEFARERVVAVSCGDFHVGAVTSNGTLYTCGWNATGALGHADTEDRPTFSRVWGLPKVVIAVACGGAHTLALVEHRGAREERTVYAFGCHAAGQVPTDVIVGDEVSDSVPVLITSLPNGAPLATLLPRPVVLPVSSADDDAPAPPSGAPTAAEPAGPTPVAIAAGFMHSAVITSDGALFMFGDGTTGALGVGLTGMPDVWKRVQKTRMKSGAGAVSRMKSFGDRLRSLGMRPSGTPPVPKKLPSDDSSDYTSLLQSLPASADAGALGRSLSGELRGPASAEPLTSPAAFDPAAPAQPSISYSTTQEGAVVGGPVMSAAYAPVNDSLREPSSDALVEQPTLDLRPRSVIFSSVYFPERSSRIAPVFVGSSRLSGLRDAPSAWIIPGLLPAAEASIDEDALPVRQMDNLGYSDDDSMGSEEDASQDGPSLPAGPALASIAGIPIVEVDTSSVPAAETPSLLVHEDTADTSSSSTRTGAALAVPRRGPPIPISERALDIRRPPSPTWVPGLQASNIHVFFDGSAEAAEASRPANTVVSPKTPKKRGNATPTPAAVPTEAAAPAPNAATTAPSAPPAAASTTVSAPTPVAADATMPAPTADTVPSETFETPIPCTLAVGPLPVLALTKREVRSVACGMGFTICTTATEWMRNEEAEFCMRCSCMFTISRRRHHCRNCGGIFCDRCSSNKLPLLKLGYISPVRVCDGCYARLVQE